MKWCKIWFYVDLLLAVWAILFVVWGLLTNQGGLLAVGIMGGVVVVWRFWDDSRHKNKEKGN